MRKLLLMTAAALMLAFTGAPGAQAAKGDFDRSIAGRYKHHSGNHHYYRNHHRRGHRKYRRYRSGPSIRLYFGTPGYYYRPRARRSYRRSNEYCAYWSRRCAANWGYGGPDYRGCMRYYKCR